MSQLTNRRNFLSGVLATGAMPFLPFGAFADEERKSTKFLFMSDTHVESDFMERGMPRYTCWQGGNHAALEKTYEFINSDEFCRDAKFALFCGDQINTGYISQKKFLDDEMVNYFRTLDRLDLHRKSKGMDLSGFKFVTKGYICRENAKKQFAVTPPPLSSRVIAIQGNHDTGVREFYRDCAFQCGDVRFITFFASYVGLPAPKGHYLSTAKIADETVDFIEREMAAAAADPAIRHIVLASHWAIAPVTPKKFVCPIRDACKENDFSDNRKKVIALAEKYGCDLYINGHEHNGEWPVMKVGPLTDINCGTVTSKNSSFAIVEIERERAVFTVYGRAVTTGTETEWKIVRQPERKFRIEIPLKPIR